jgi:hypothetical protein
MQALPLKFRVFFRASLAPPLDRSFLWDLSLLRNRLPLQDFCFGAAAKLFNFACANAL